MKARTTGVLIILPILASLAAGCVFSPKKDPPKPQPDTRLPQDSPANCLANLQSAYVDRNLDHYIELFASDFTFVFSPTDVTNPINPTPQRWGLAEERSVHDKMFHSELVDRIELSFQQATADSAADKPAGWWKVELNTINLRVFTRKEDGTPWEYRVPNGTATFYFKEYPDEKASNGKPLWRIIEWDDKPIGGGAAVKPPSA